jgi:hypothetical protein
MTDTGPSSPITHRYRFSRPGGAEIETRDLDSDEAAEAQARELSKGQDTPVIVEHHDHVDWEYVTEVDNRP